MSTRIEKIEKTVKWLQEKVAETHAKGLIVGVSGGIDFYSCGIPYKKSMPR